MNPILKSLPPYPFDRLRTLLGEVSPNAVYSPIALSIGEPRHPSPACVRLALTAALDGLSSYPPTAGGPELRSAVADWLAERHAGAKLDPETEILPVNGSKEALFSIADALLSPLEDGSPATVIIPNPCYQVYEGAALLAGGQTAYVNQGPATDFLPDWAAIDEATWRKTRLVYLCSPGNPTGRNLSIADWQILFERADRYGFTILADECYSEIHFDDNAPPVGALAAAAHAGRTDWRRLLVFSSLSKRSSVPGLRSGFVAGDAELIHAFRLYRTYSGGAMSATIQHASVGAWRDETHVRENRALYRAKFEAVLPVLEPVLPVKRPDGGFFLWVPVPGGDDAGFTRELFRHYNVRVLPGSYLAREAHGFNPGAGFVRIALVESLQTCVEAATRIRDFVSKGPGA